jgi:putative polyhydroxyalkanoate system protein
MSEIRYKREHHLSVKEARKIAQKAADDLGQEYDLVSEWEGDTLHFHRSGVDGHMHVTAHYIDLNVRLGFLLRPFKSAFERHIERNLDMLLATNPKEKAAKAAKAAKKTSPRKA